MNAGAQLMLPFWLSLGPQPDTAALEVGLPISLNLMEIIPHRYEQNYRPVHFVNPSCWQSRLTITFRRRPEQHHLQKSQAGAYKETKQDRDIPEKMQREAANSDTCRWDGKALPRGVFKKARGSRLEPFPTLMQKSECMWGRSFWCPQTTFFCCMSILLFYRTLLRQLWIQTSASSLLFLALNKDLQKMYAHYLITTHKYLKRQINFGMNCWSERLSTPKHRLTADTLKI